MSEFLQTRTEYSRSIEDAEKYRALEVLKEVGLLIPVSELETYHGRAGSTQDTEEWDVDPAFSNAGNDSGSRNVNKRSTLYTSDYETAQDFADEKSGFSRLYFTHLYKRVKDYTPEENVGRLERQNAHLEKLWKEDVARGHADPKTSSPIVWTMDQLLKSDSIVEALHLGKTLGRQGMEDFKTGLDTTVRTEVHDITSYDTDATVLDFTFDKSTLDDAAKEKYNKALQTLAIPIPEGSPVSWEDRDSAYPFFAAVQKAQKYIVFQGDIHKLAADAGVGEAAALHLASAYNSKVLSTVMPSYLVSQLLKNSNDIVTLNIEINGQRQDVPVNLEYVQRYVRELHIVGVRQPIGSATLNRDIMSVSFFDLEKTKTVNGVEKARRETWRKLGGIAASLDEVLQPEVHASPRLIRLLEDPHVKPEKLVKAAMEVEGYDEIFAADAGNWEGFTLAEHTETVLRNFDESFAEQLPVEMLAPMRLAIVAHDIGKPAAVAEGQKRRQKEFNISQADDFLTKLGIEDKLKGLLIAIIGDGSELSYLLNVRKAGEPAEKAMRAHAITSLQKFYGKTKITDQQIDGFVEMCTMLQVCDGGAYTSMAITRKDNGKGRHRNAPSFNASFAQPVGFGKRSVRLRAENDVPAARDLTPKAEENPSRLKTSNRGAGRKAPKLST
jgi:hypothetical protein